MIGAAKRLIALSLQRMGYNIVHAEPAPGAQKRYDYQRKYFGDFGIKPGQRVLDVGPGGYPFPLATHWLDLPEGKRTGYDSIPDVSEKVIRGDIHEIPVEDGHFDFVYCSHVLEHVDDPVKACRELMRVAPRGYIECPSVVSDTVFGWARKAMHRWHVVAHGKKLWFFQYSERQIDGHGSHAFISALSGRWRTPMMDAFRENRDLFEVMFPWEGKFDVEVIRNDD